MICDRARRLFGACWDDELTQAEREWLEAHFVSCARCRTEYDGFSRSVELAGALPRVEASAGLAERALARARRGSAVPDRVAQTGVRWMPIAAAAAAAAAIVVALVILPRTSWWNPGRGEPLHVASRPAVVLPNLKQPVRAGQPAVAVRLPERRGMESGLTAVVPDSMFDHSEDVEFILDPVAIHRGRASVTRPNSRVTGVQGQQALITF
jgi:hypothetical protein